MKLGKKTIAIMALGVSGSLFAAKGGTPNGKPFVQINDQIVEVKSSLSTIQDQIESLMGKVTSLEADVEAHGTAISLLEQQNSTFLEMINANKDSIDGVKAQIQYLNDRNAQIMTEISNNTADIMGLQSEMMDNSALISSLQAALAGVQSQVSDINAKIASLETANATFQASIDANSGDIQALQNAIDANNSQISSLQGELAALEPLKLQVEENTLNIGSFQGELAALTSMIEAKQNLINGNCPDGSAIGEVFEDGTVSCNSVVGSTGELRSYNAVRTDFVYRYQTLDRALYCTPGYEAVSYGHIGFDIRFHESRPMLNHEWSVKFQNLGRYHSNLTSFVKCLKVD